jgi:hypothetical protein
MIFSDKGLPLQGMTGGERNDFPLKKEMREGVTLFIE